MDPVGINRKEHEVSPWSGSSGPQKAPDHQGFRLRALRV